MKETIIHQNKRRQGEKPGMEEKEKKERKIV